MTNQSCPAKESALDESLVPSTHIKLIEFILSD